MTVKVAAAFGLTLLVIMMGTTDGYPTGAPAGACDTMIPGHGFQPKTSTLPYFIRVSGMSYCPNIPVKVTLEAVPSGTEFKGFLCQPRSSVDSTTTVGTFNQPMSTKNNCVGKAAITHSSNSMKKSVEFTWTPNSNVRGNVSIVCTFVQQKDTYWVKGSSYAMQYAGDVKCANPGQFPTSCTNSQQCNNAVSMSECMQGRCMCPSDMKKVSQTDTFCTNKELGDSCTNDNDCKYAENSKCTNMRCACSSTEYVETRDATHKYCMKSGSPTLVLSVMLMVGCLLAAVF